MNNLFPLEYNSLDLFGKFWLCLLVSIVHLWILHLTTLAGQWVRPINTLRVGAKTTWRALERRQAYLTIWNQMQHFSENRIWGRGTWWPKVSSVSIWWRPKTRLHWGQQFSRCRRNIWRVREMAKWAKWVNKQQIEVHEIKSRRWKTGVRWVGWSDWVGGWWGRRQPRHWAKWLEHSFPPHLHHSACHPNHIILHHTPPPPPFPPPISLPPLPTVPPPISLHTPPPPPPPQSVSMSYSTMFSNHQNAAARFIFTFDSFSSNFVVFTAGW